MPHTCTVVPRHSSAGWMTLDSPRPRPNHPRGPGRRTWGFFSLPAVVCFALASSCGFDTLRLSYRDLRGDDPEAIELVGPCPVEHDDCGQKPARSGLCASRASETAVDAREDAGSSQPCTEASSAPVRRGASPRCVAESAGNRQLRVLVDDERLSIEGHLDHPGDRAHMLDRP